MKRPWAYFVAAAGLKICLTSPMAHACSTVGLEAHVVDTRGLTTDNSPPVLTAQPAVTVYRGRGPRSDGCGQSVSSCDGLGTVVIAVQASDDLSAPESLGYRLSLVAGQPPAGLVLPRYPVRAQPSGQIILVWDDGESDSQEPIDFTLEIVPMDAVGNEGTPVSLRVQDPGHSTACGIARDAGRGPSPPLGALALLLLAWAQARRRRTRALTS